MVVVVVEVPSMACGCTREGIGQTSIVKQEQKRFSLALIR